MKIVIIDYESGNVKSVEYAMARLGYKTILSNNESDLRTADKIIFPGVGEASSAMEKLKEYNLDKVIPTLKQDVLGICLGMQLLCKSTVEGNTAGLGVFTTSVFKFEPNMKVPHIGWNQIEKLKSPLFKGIVELEYMYYVHGYYASVGADTIAATNYNGAFAAALNKDNFYGVQFHPEKSGPEGLKLLENFIKL